jgi:hypothetical protein
MVWTCLKDGRGKVATRSYVITSTRKKKIREI